MVHVYSSALTRQGVRFAVLLALVILGTFPFRGATPRPQAFPDLRSVAPDLTPVPMTIGVPAAGLRVKQTTPGFLGVYHTLYLPENWKAGRHYPVIVEYAGNGPYVSPEGDVSSGKVEDSKLGYGMSGGKGFIWICMPFVNTQARRNATWWWGNTEATVQYCKATVRQVCEQYGGDPSRVVLCGFSRGAIACNYIGLYDEEIADLWLAFIPYSHYDGVGQWDWEGSDRASALVRLQRLKGRASFICQERAVDDIRAYIRSSGTVAPFTFRVVPFRNHNDAWVLRDTPARRALRAWLGSVLAARPGTHSIRGRVATANGRPVRNVRIASGYSHFTDTDRNGQFVLSGLIDSRRSVTASKPGLAFSPPAATVEVRGEDVAGLTFTASR